MGEVGTNCGADVSAGGRDGTGCVAGSVLHVVTTRIGARRLRWELYLGFD